MSWAERWALENGPGSRDKCPDATPTSATTSATHTRTLLVACHHMGTRYNSGVSEQALVQRASGLEKPVECLP